MSFSYKDFQTAVMAQVVDAALPKLAGGQQQVVFGNQKASAPQQDYVSVTTVSGPASIGTTPAVVERYSATAPLGQEISKTYQGPGRMVLSIQAYTVAFEDAMDVVSAIKQHFGLGSVNDALIMSGITVIDRGAPRNIPKVFGADMEGRAVFELTLYVEESAQEQLGYVTQINGLVPVVDPKTGVGRWVPGKPAPEVLVKVAQNYIIANPKPSDGTSVNPTGIVAASTNNQMAGPFTNPDVARGVRVAFPVGWDGGSITVTGTDFLGNAVTATYAANPGGVTDAPQVFASISGASKGLVGANGGSATLGLGPALGLPAQLADANVMLLANTVGCGGTVNTVYNSVTPEVAPDGATSYSVNYNTTDQD